MNEDFLKSVMESLISMPFLETCDVYIEARNPDLEHVLRCYEKAGLLKNFTYRFQPLASY